jgi:hypothetical protein
MSLASGDLTTPERVVTWLSVGPNLPSAIISQLISSMSNLIQGKLNRSRIFSQTYTRTFDGLGNMQLVLPDYPVTKLISVTQGQRNIPLSQASSPGQIYGCRLVTWNGELPGENATLEFASGFFYQAPQNINVTYQAGYAIQDEVASIPAVSPYVVTVQQAQGVCSRDLGVVYANGTPLVAVAASPTIGQYIPPVDANPGLYTFSAGDAGASVLISYSFVPSDLEEATIQMVAERYSYRSRVGEVAKSLGGQETMSYWRGNSRPPWNRTSSLPPEVMDLIWPYVNVVAPLIGAPV